MKKIAVILAGSGALDGSELHESVLTLLAISQANVEYQCFSIDKNQYRVMNHLTSQPTDEIRNMMVESGRIARGNVLPLSCLSLDSFSAIIIPGGNGITYNLFDFACSGINYHVQPELVDICNQFTKAEKPIGFICIAPLMIPAIYNFPVECTIGHDTEISEILSQRGAIHCNHTAEEIHVDEQHKIVSTPAYMLANNISQVYSGINKLVTKIVSYIC